MAGRINFMHNEYPLGLITEKNEFVILNVKFYMKKIIICILDFNNYKTK